MLVPGDDDDIVIQAFKEQTKQYKQISEAAKVLKQCVQVMGHRQ